MGLDIGIGFDNSDYLCTIDAFDKNTKHAQLSRTFCNFLLRKDVVNPEDAELYQLGELTGIDISFLYLMEEYSPEDFIEETLSYYKDATIRDRAKAKIIDKNKLVDNNISLVIERLTLFVEKLSTIPDLENKIRETSYDTLGIATYFSRFNEDLGNGYIGNNLGQDLRNLLKAVELGYKYGAKTVFFHFS